LRAGDCPERSVACAVDDCDSGLAHRSPEYTAVAKRRSFSSPFRRKGEAKRSLFFPLPQEGRSDSERARSATRGMAFPGMAFRPTAHPPPHVPSGTRGDPFLRKG